MIEQDSRAVEIHRRSQCSGAEYMTDGRVRLDSLGVDVPLDAIYEDVPVAR